MKSLSIVLLVLFGVNAFAVNVSVTKSQLDKLASDFFMNESSAKLALTGETGARAMLAHGQCDQDDEDRGQSCSDVACEKLGSMGCNEMSEIEEVGRVCRGNVNGKCVRATCERLGDMGCNEMSEIERVATSCRGNFSGRCVEVVCTHLGSMGCNEMSEVEQVGAICKGTKASCIEDVCRRLGSMSCNEMSEIEQVADSCRGK